MKERKRERENGKEPVLLLRGTLRLKTITEREERITGKVSECLNHGNVSRDDDVKKEGRELKEGRMWEEEPRK